MPLTPTPQQLRCLLFVAGYLETTRGVSPTVRECAAAIGQPFSGNIQRMLIALEQRGHLRRLPGRARAIELLHPVAIPRAPDGAPLYAVTPRQQAAR